MVTDEGTGNAELLLESATVAPPDGALSLSEIVSVAVCPPVTLDGEIETELSAGSWTGVSVTAAVFVLPESVALTVAVTVEVTDVVWTLMLP